MGADVYHRTGRMLRKAGVLEARPDLGAVYDAVDAQFPVRVTSSFAARMDLTDPLDPLALQVLPHPAELDLDGLDDPVGEKAHSPVPWLVRKYEDRALLLVTKRCHLYCRYCFRRTHAPGEQLDPTGDALEAALAYIGEAEGLREVILSGGDPLILPRARLLSVIDRIRSFGLRVRIHTRAPITFPESVDPALATELAARGVFMVVHCNHPRELSPDVEQALATLVDGGVPVLDQTVLLAGVNDDPDVLVELFEALLRQRVRPYYLHHPDEVEGNAHFRVTRERGWAVWTEVRRRIGGLAVPRYVWDPPSGEGKREVAPPAGDAL